MYMAFTMQTDATALVHRTCHGPCSRTHFFKLEKVE